MHLATGQIRKLASFRIPKTRLNRDNGAAAAASAAEAALWMDLQRHLRGARTCESCGAGHIAPVLRACGRGDKQHDGGDHDDDDCPQREAQMRPATHRHMIAENRSVVLLNSLLSRLSR